MGQNKQLFMNLLSSIIAFTVSMGISFILTPYIIRNIGVEANGFVLLGSNIINYVSLVTIALNSMSGRYITIEIHKGNWVLANKFFNSVFYSNLIVSAFLLIPAMGTLFYLETFLNIPSEILVDVRILFIFLFANFLISIAMSTFNVATFATNRLYLNSMRTIEANIIKALLLLILFTFFDPSISFLGFSTFIVLLYTSFFDAYYTKKFLPQIQIKKKYFDLSLIKELIAAGIWNTITRVGKLLLDGVDLLLANLFIDATAMGILGLSKNVPNLIYSLMGVIGGVFMPDFTKLFAQENNEQLLISIKRSMKLLGIVVSIPMAVLIAFGYEFFSLWVPSQNAQLLQILSIINVFTIVISGPMNGIYGIFTVTNKLKANAYVLLITGIVNIIIVFALLHYTNLGIFAITGVSTFFGILRNLIFTAPYGAKCLGLTWTTFYPEIMKSVFSTAVITGIGFVFGFFLSINSWLMLFIAAVLTCLVGLFVTFLLLLNREERFFIKNIVFKGLRK